VPQPQPRRPAPQQPKAAPLKPAAKPAPPKPAAKPAPAPAQKGSATRPTGRLKGLLNGLSDSDSPSRSTGKPAAKAGSAVEASLVAEVRRQLKPQWQRVVPTGADAENLRTEVRLTLARDGRVSRIDVVGTTGVTASNRPQVALHQERAKKAVMLASPFRLPAEFYDTSPSI
jgi:outer membrane biosynthesis protein TonB